MDQYLTPSSGVQSLMIDMNLINSIPMYSINEAANSFTGSPSTIFEKSMSSIDDNDLVRKESEQLEREEKKRIQKAKDEKQKQSWLEYVREMFFSNSHTLKFFEDEIEEIFFLRRFEELSRLQTKIDQVFLALCSHNR
jgi:hypothetical protein